MARDQRLHARWANEVLRLVLGHCALEGPICRALPTHVHHAFPVAEYPQYQYELWNGVVLCEMHHMGVRDPAHPQNVEWRRERINAGCLDYRGEAFVDRMRWEGRRRLATAMTRAWARMGPLTEEAGEIPHESTRTHTWQASTREEQVPPRWVNAALSSLRPKQRHAVSAAIGPHWEAVAAITSAQWGGLLALTPAQQRALSTLTEEQKKAVGWGMATEAGRDLIAKVKGDRTPEQRQALGAALLAQDGAGGAF